MPLFLWGMETADSQPVAVAEDGDNGKAQAVATAECAVAAQRSAVIMSEDANQVCTVDQLRIKDLDVNAVIDIHPFASRMHAGDRRIIYGHR